MARLLGFLSLTFAYLFSAFNAVVAVAATAWKVAFPTASLALAGGAPWLSEPAYASVQRARQGSFMARMLQRTEPTGTFASGLRAAC